MQYRKKSHRLRYKTGERTVYIKYTELNSNKHQIKKTNMLAKTEREIFHSDQQYSLEQKLQ